VKLVGEFRCSPPSAAFSPAGRCTPAARPLKTGCARVIGRMDVSAPGTRMPSGFGLGMNDAGDAGRSERRRLGHQAGGGGGEDDPCDRGMARGRAGITEVELVLPVRHPHWSERVGRSQPSWFDVGPWARGTASARIVGLEVVPAGFGQLAMHRRPTATQGLRPRGAHVRARLNANISPGNRAWAAFSELVSAGPRKSWE